MTNEPPFHILATFRPKHMDTLRVEAVPYVGQRIEFTRCWIVTEEDGGPYVGQWTWQPTRGELGWVPDEDLEAVEPR